MNTRIIDGSGDISANNKSIEHIYQIRKGMQTTVAYFFHGYKSMIIFFTNQKRIIKDHFGYSQKILEHGYMKLVPDNNVQLSHRGTGTSIMQLKLAWELASID